MMKLLLVMLLGVISHSGLVYCKSECSTFKNCGSCIGYASERCVWCAQDTINSSLPEEERARCRSREEIYKDGQLNTEWCSLNSINDPKSLEPNVLANEKFNQTPGHQIQFRPQEIELTLRPGVPVTFDMHYKLAKDYPLDLYFVIDDSYTMDKYAKELANQTLAIYEALKNLTNNVRLGFGTFVEKPALPYCDPITRNCSAFEHHLSLTDNMTLFETRIKSYTVSGSNYDSPESGFDALMQVMTCGDKIGWRVSSENGGTQIQARRIVILATDATYHSAGDGKMVGAYIPNDMKCHLDENNIFYDKEFSRTIDYPSVSQISYVAKQNNFRIVFSVLSSVLNVYKALEEDIFEAKSVELKEEKIQPIIKEAYIRASRDVIIQQKNKPDSIKFETDCDIKPNNCTVTKENPEVKIKATVTALSCDSVPDFVIYPFGLSDELVVKLKINCKCPCEIGTGTSEECSSEGTKQCGICYCNPNRSGDKCETACSDENDLAIRDLCKEQLNDTTSYCSNNGKCVCGQCQCDNNYSGKYCQFNDAVCRQNCPAGQGECYLGKCQCNKSWTGPKCSCSVHDTECIGPFSEKPCSGQGTCKCGKCECSSIDGTNYFGTYCESCKTCSTKLCEQLKDYANCNFEKNSKEDCDKRFNQTSVDTVINMNRTALDAQMTATSCRKKLSNEKILVFKYEIVKDKTKTAKLVLMIQDELESPPVANIWVTIGSVVGGVLLIGLLTLIIWKILTNMWDKKEYEKFCQEASSAGFDVTNPVYQDPNVNFVNPAYCPSNTN